MHLLVEKLQNQQRINNLCSLNIKNSKIIPKNSILNFNFHHAASKLQHILTDPKKTSQQNHHRHKNLFHPSFLTQTFLFPFFLPFLCSFLFCCCFCFSYFFAFLLFIPVYKATATATKKAVNGNKHRLLFPYSFIFNIFFVRYLFHFLSHSILLFVDVLIIFLLFYFIFFCFIAVFI